MSSTGRYVVERWGSGWSVTDLADLDHTLAAPRRHIPDGALTLEQADRLVARLERGATSRR